MPARLFVKAIRDSGYKSAAYAIAELADNAIQAGANSVEIICEEKEDRVNRRTRRRVQKIAVVDNGTGMDADTLRKALQFGNGSRLEDRKGIGRFGMGLPNSSLSQAQRVDVYTWTDGIGNAIHSYLDVNKIAGGEMREVPQPEKATVPQDWIAISSTMSHSRSGTIVIWSNLDRCDWKTANAIFRNSEYTIGRIYRRMLGDSSVAIRMAAFLEGERSPNVDERVVPNDPGYLMATTSCPSPWSDTPMFEPYGDPEIIEAEGVDGQNHQVVIRFSMAKREARNSDNAGANRHGKHARDNIGVSVVRAGRELELQTEWCTGYDPRDRWWGIEVEFPPALDEIFGVTNNKQSATTLKEYARLPQEQLAERENFESYHDLFNAWQEDRDTRLPLIRVKKSIEANLSAIRGILKAREQGRRPRDHQRHDANSAEVKGTKATQLRKDEGHVGASDCDEQQAAETRRAEIEQDLRMQGLDDGEAAERAGSVVDDGRKYEFFRTDLATPEFFTVRRKGGALLIGLNTEHPAYDQLVTVMDHSEDETNVELLQGRLQRAYEGLKLLLEAWARYEDECPDGRKRELAQEARQDWGRVARSFFGVE